MNDQTWDGIASLVILAPILFVFLVGAWSFWIGFKD